MEQCSDGQISELPNVSIDNFGECNRSSTCFFLTHCHGDHMNGLEPAFYNFLRNNPGYYLYCSPFTRHILINDQNWGGDGLSCENDFIKELEGKTVITVPGRDETKTASYELTVTAIPVDHCLGSVMFLFESPRTTVLFTGDFRIIKGDTPKFKELKPYCDGFNKIDKLYFDVTFLNENYLEFPEISESVDLISDIFRKWLEADSNNHVNLMKYPRYGYEYALIKLAEIFKYKIHVDEWLFKVYADIPEIGSKLTTNSNETRIHYCQRDFTGCEPSQLRTVTISAKNFKTGSSYCRRISENEFAVCWATHSSRSEIIDFLRHLKPKAIQASSEAVDLSSEDVKLSLDAITSNWE